jgi:hypothetical protein
MNKFTFYTGILCLLDMHRNVQTKKATFSNNQQ